MSSDSNNNDDDNDGMGIAYTTNEEYSNRNDIRSLSTNPVEYLEYVAEQEQFSPRNLSIHQDSLQLNQPPPPHEQFIHLKQAPINVNYIIRDDNSQPNLTNNNNNNNNNNNTYNPYFPPTEQQVQQFYSRKHISNQLSPLDEVVHNNPYPEPHRVEIINNNNNQQNPSQGYQLHQLQQQLQQFQPPPKPIPNHNNDNSDSNNDNNETLRSPIDHSTDTPSPLALPGLYLTRNRSRVSTPKIENLPRIPSAYTAQVQQSDSPLRTEFRNNEIVDRSSGPSKRDTFKNMLGEILNQDRLTNINERTAIKDPNERDETLVKFDFRNANGDPDDPLLNNKNIPIQEEEQQLPTGLLNGNVNNNNNNNNNNDNNNTLNISHQDSNDSSIVSPISPISPTSQVTPILKKSMTDDKDHDVIIIGDQEIKLLKPKQGAIFMLIAVFVMAAIVFIAWKLGDWGVGDAKNIYNYSANNGVVLVYPSGTKKSPPISSNSSRKLKRSTY